MVFSKYKTSRLVNINVNIILSAVLGIIISAYPIYISKDFIHSPEVIVVFSLFINAIVDVIIFAGLHFYVHKHHVRGFKVSRILWADLVKIQTQRVFLSVIYIFISAGLHYVLLRVYMERTISFVIAYLIALAVCRGIHTFYGIRSGLFKEI